MKTINEFMKTHLPSEYNGFSIGEFLDNKILKIESVRSDKVSGKRCIKTDVRIVSDKEGDNLNKVFTVRLDETDDFEEGEFEGYLKETKNYLGFPLLLDVDQDIEQVYFFQQNMLTLVVNDYSVDTEAEKKDIELTSMKDRPLKNIKDYRVFDIESFVKENNIKFIGTYYEKGSLIFNTLVNENFVLKISVPIEKFDSLPASLLTLNATFDQVVSDFTFSHTISHRYGTRWTLCFEDITFKPGVITKNFYKLAYDEPTLEVSNDYDEGSLEKQHNLHTKEQSQTLGDKETNHSSYKSSSPFGGRRQI